MFMHVYSFACLLFFVCLFIVYCLLVCCLLVIVFVCLFIVFCLLVCWVFFVCLFVEGTVNSCSKRLKMSRPPGFVFFPPRKP